MTCHAPSYDRYTNALPIAGTWHLRSGLYWLQNTGEPPASKRHQAFLFGEGFYSSIYGNFSNLYHNCSYPGCRLCMASDAGFVEYPSLPGTIRTWCVNSPAFKSRFCTQHCPRSCVSKKFVWEWYNPQNAVESPEKSSSETGESIIEMILEKRETCSRLYYKVRTTNNTTHNTIACMWILKPDFIATSVLYSMHLHIYGTAHAYWTTCTYCSMTFK